MLRVSSRAARIWQRRTTSRTRSTGYRKLPTPDFGNGLPLTVSASAGWRTFGGVPTIVLPPVVFGGLVAALWSWKCLMMVLFQNKIIYMPGLPPNARKEKIENYQNQCGGIQWRHESAISEDGTRISLCVASVDSCLDPSSHAKTVYILYFQGNASSIPPRLPLLSPVLRLLKARSLSPVRYTMVCCSYRGYWSSEGHPSERGITMDALAAMAWIREFHDSETIGSGGEHATIVIWGQSIGASVGISLAAKYPKFSQTNLSLSALILETPFLSTRSMLETLYPQKWLPYRHLWPFLWNHLDSWNALGLMQRNFENCGLKSPTISILQAGKDELVPKEHGDTLQRRCLELNLDIQKKIISGSIHTEVMARHGGRMAVVEAVEAAVGE